MSACINTDLDSTAPDLFGLGGECEYMNTMKPLSKDTFGTSRFVLCREVVLFQMWFSIECVYMSTFGLSFILSECPLSEVSLIGCDMPLTYPPPPPPPPPPLSRYLSNNQIATIEDDTFKPMLKLQFL